MNFPVKLKYLIVLLLLGFTGIAQVDFKARVNRNEIGKNEQLNVQFVVNAEASDFEPPSFDGFMVLAGPNRSTSMRIINYERSMQISYGYVLQPRKAGVFTIGRASVKVQGETYTTEPIQVKVTAESPRASDPNDPYSQAAKKAFFRVITSKSRVYQGEPLVASYKLYFTTGIARPEVIDEPSFTGFYKSPLKINHIKTKQETYRGQAYNTGILRQLVLIPQQTGSIKPGSVDLRIPTELPTNRRDVFGRRITQRINQTATEDFPTITVRPLPERGKPSSFDGAVGDYDFSVTVSRNELSANESVTLKVKVSGSGNIKLIDAPEPEIPSAFEAYDPKYSENISVNASGMSGSKTYEYLLIPRYSGTYKIPELAFSYFDPRLGRYQTLTSEEIQVKVTGGVPQPGQDEGVVYSGKEDVNFIGKDILFIKTETDEFREVGYSFLNSSKFYTIVSGMGLTWAGMLGWFFFVSNRKQDQRRLRSKKAGSKARKQLSQAKKALESNDNEKFYEALSSALWGYFADKFNIPQSRLSKDEIRRQLVEKGIDEFTVDHIIDSINNAEMARYTATGAQNPEHDYEQAAQLLTQIENNL